VRGAPSETPYAAVAKLNNTGGVEGVFSIPVRNKQEIYKDRRNAATTPIDGIVEDDEEDDDDFENEQIDVSSWGSMPRGIYYLGKDLDDCNNREWVLCQEVDKVLAISPIKE
jgi:hypothetical protein